MKSGFKINFMQFSSGAGYGLQAMTRLAVAYNSDKPILHLAELSVLDDVPENYLERVLRKLRKAQLIESVQGRKGGYRLSRAPKKITAKEILETLEGNLFPYKCFCGCDSGTCLTRGVWHKLYLSITKTLDNITLSDLIKK